MLPQCPQRHPQEREGLPYHGHQRREDGTCGGPHWSGGTPEPFSSTAGSRGQGPPGLSGCAETLSPPCRSPHSPDGQDGSALVPLKLFLLLQMNSVRESICLDLALRPCPGWVSWSQVRWGAALLGRSRGPESAGPYPSPCQWCEPMLATQSSQHRAGEGAQDTQREKGRFLLGVLGCVPGGVHGLSWRSSARGHFPVHNPSVAPSIMVLPSFLLV